MKLGNSRILNSQPRSGSWTKLDSASVWRKQHDYTEQKISVKNEGDVEILSDKRNHPSLARRNSKRWPSPRNKVGPRGRSEVQEAERQRHKDPSNKLIMYNGDGKADVFKNKF